MKSVLRMNQKIRIPFWIQFCQWHKKWKPHKIWKNFHIRRAVNTVIGVSHIMKNDLNLRLFVFLECVIFSPWPSRQFLIHQKVHPSDPCLSSLETRMSRVKCSAQVQVGDVSTLPLIYQHCNLQIHQAPSAFSEEVLAVTNHLLKSHVP